jgi:hypothetical protein
MTKLMGVFHALLLSLLCFFSVNVFVPAPVRLRFDVSSPTRLDLISFVLFVP